MRIREAGIPSYSLGSPAAEGSRSLRFVSPLDADAFFGDEDFIADAEAVGFCEQALDGFVEGFVSERESAVMHGDEDFRAEIGEGTDGLLGVHVDIAAAGGFVGTDGHECDVDAVTFADFGEAVEVGAVAAVKNAFAAGFHDVATVVAMGVVDVTCAPMMTRSMDDSHAIDFHFIPNIDFVDGRETEFFDQRCTTFRDDDAIASLENFQAGFVEVIEVGVGDEYEVDLWNIFEIKSRMALAFYGAMPFRPVGIDQYRVPCELEEKRCVTNPCDADAVICWSC